MFGFRFVKFQPSEYVLKYSNGKIVKEGTGLSFCYYVPSTSIVVVPAGSADVPFIFEEITSDFQNVTVQGQVTYRIVDQKKITRLLNYTLNMNGKGYVSEDPKRLPQRIINIVRVLTKKNLENMQLREAIKSSELLANEMLKSIRENEEIKSLGMEILGLSILAVLPIKVSDLSSVMKDVLDNKRPVKDVSMAKAVLNDGQTIYAVNDLYIGQKTHVSSRYEIELGNKKEHQSSSRTIVFFCKRTFSKQEFENQPCIRENNKNCSFEGPFSNA